MRVNTIKNTLKALPLVLALGTGVATAATFTQNGQITILAALGVVEDTKLNFGTIENPSSTVIAHVTTAGAEGGSHSATNIDTAARTNGSFTISGSASNTVAISATDGANVTGLSYTAIAGSVDGAADVNLLTGTTGVTLGGGDAVLDVGAELTVLATVADGTHNPEFDLDVSYE